ncbi:MAG: HNH endonuclease [Pirellulaceae bacterium]
MKSRLEAATSEVVAVAQAFDVAAQQHTIHTLPRQALGHGVTTADMEKVYSQRMARRGAPGREIYDELFESSPHGRCPLCAQRSVATLDHYLPKAHYPALAVTPLNLVPCCTDCNKAKLDAIPRSPESVSLNPYYDQIDDHRWLSAEVVQTRPSAVLFSISAPAQWDATLTARVENHFRMFGLARLYASQAAEELLNIRQQLLDLQARGGTAAVRAQLQERAASAERARSNGWRAATYRAWSISAWFCRGGFA